MMSLGPGAAANKKAALEQLKFKKKQKQQNSSVDESVLPASASWTAAGTTLDRPPAQSRDATIPSRYFSATPVSPGNVLAPNSSSPPHDPSHHSNRSFWQSDSLGDGIPGLIHSRPPSQPFTPVRVDPLTAPSGFVRGNSVPHASFTRRWNGNGRQMSETEDSGDGERPRKRINRGRSPKDPLDLLTSPESPEVQAPGRKRRVNGTFSLSSISSDESVSDAMDVAGPSRSRIVRHAQSPQEPPSSSQPSQSESEDPRFTRFKMVQPLHPLSVVRAAWDQAGGDVQKASALLTDPSWRPPSASNGKPVARPTAETGRVKEIDEANKAQRAAIRERGKQSMIYKSRPALDGKPPSKPGPSTPSLAAADLDPPQTPGSPVVSQPLVKRLKRKVIDSESEAESVDSEASARVARPKEDSRHELRVLNYFNTAAAEGLQEITGCSVEQANKIIELRPFSSVADLQARLSQGKKKAGPAGISPRMFEDCVAIFEGYGRVDSILQDCEEIGAELKAEIASWTKHSRSRDPSLGVENTNPTDGTLSLHDQADLTDSKPSYYLTSQPSLLEAGVQLKEYQMIGINWLNLLYRKKLSCILADEMGLGKTIQVISFFAHLKEKGRHGPHLIVVPSSTLENWCREFDRFASNMSVTTYYGGKEERPALRQSLLETRYNNKTGEGWEVLITTYNLAQGDEKDRKFFRKIEWDACVFDEGHVLKNFQSQRYQTLLRYESRWRLLLTGTPLQNNLQELVSLMNFILPQQFAADLDSLRAVFKTKGDSKVTLLAQERVSRAKKMLTPFVLRRRKDQVLKDLPKKNERIEWCDMTPLQRSIYNEALQRSRKTIFDVDAQAAEIVDEPKPAKRTRANTRPKDKLYVENSSNVLMDLRKAASHPMLFRRRFTDDTLTRVAKLLLKEPDFKRRKAVFQYIKEDLEVMTDAELQEYCASYNSTRKFLQAESCYLEAGKVKVLMQLLDKYQAAGRRVLIFSQFTQILDILQKVLQQKSIKYLVLTGSTPVDNRQSLVDDFHTDESITVFLLSTKAGGMGINLTAASVVILFDQDFNPHNDKQAQDRAYRIGQKQDVDVIKLITKGSIEEDMLALGQTKLALDEAVAGEEGEEEKVEKEMKTSLMNVVRKKLQETQDEDVPMPDAEPIDDDIGSPLSVLDDT